MVYYRKYRPQLISELDSAEIRAKLTSVLWQAAPTFINVPHAFLFTGPKGLGKTSTARIVAKVINCTGRKDTSGKDIEPCNTCDECLSITQGTNMDILEIDGASNRGIDEMRDLKEKIRLAPLNAKKKIYIIDEVHMLTTEAFNALLKTLEEPPSHAVFMLCTTEMHKVPPTILSRCMHIAFTLATEKELVRSLQRVAKGEGITAPESVLESIAALAEGGFRDGTKIFEELVALSGGKKVDPQFLENKYHVQSTSQQGLRLLHSLEERDTAMSLAIISELVSLGVDAKYFLTSFVALLHLLLLQRAGVAQDAPKSTLTLQEVTQLIKLMTTALTEMKSTVIPSLPLELAIISWVHGGGESLILTPKETAVVAQNAKVEEVSVASLRKQVGEMAKMRAVNGEEPKKEAVAKGDPSDVSILKFAATGEHSEEWILSLWKNIISSMKEHNHMIAGVLRSCKLVGFDRKVLVIQAASSFHKDRLMEPKAYQALLEVCATLVGNQIAVTIELKS